LIKISATEEKFFLATKDTKEHEDEENYKSKIRTEEREMVPMGNTLRKCGTMVDRESKIFAGSRGGFFKKSPWNEVNK